MRGVALKDAETRRWWNALRVNLSGRSGLIAIPVYSKDTAGYQDGTFEPLVATEQVTCVEAVGIGATTIKLQGNYGSPVLFGTRFSYQNALYETGYGTPVSGVWTMPIFPAIRAAIPAGAVLETANPTCLVRLADDRGMDVAMSAGRVDLRDVTWIEATDYWNDLALGVI